MPNLQLIISAILLGIGLAMDAFSVSLANGLAEPMGTKRRAAAIALTFALFQAAMPMIGWVLVHTMAELFTTFQKFIPFIALALLLFIGGKMIIEGIRESKNEETCMLRRTAFGALLVQGVATSIDALSVGFTIADYGTLDALVAAAIIGVTTFALCFIGVRLGRVFGTKLACKATIFGGAVLVLVGIEIFITGLF